MNKNDREPITKTINCDYSINDDKKSFILAKPFTLRWTLGRPKTAYNYNYCQSKSKLKIWRK